MYNDSATCPVCTAAKAGDPAFASACECGHTVNLHCGAEPLACLPGCPCQGWAPSAAAARAAAELGHSLGLHDSAVAKQRAELEPRNIAPGDVLYVAVGSHYGPQSTEVKTVEWASDNGSSFRFTDGTYSDITRVRIKSRAAAAVAELAELEELRALADTADETAATLWDNYSAARAGLELIRRQLDDMAERAEMASRAADAARGKVRAAMRAARLVLTADGYAPEPQPSGIAAHFRGTYLGVGA